MPLNKPTNQPIKKKTYKIIIWLQIRQEIVIFLNLKH